MMFDDQGNSIWHNPVNACANSLHWMAKWLDPAWPGGMDYVKLNVILFCLVLPVVLFVSLGLNLASWLGWL